MSTNSDNSPNKKLQAAGIFSTIILSIVSILSLLPRFLSNNPDGVQNDNIMPYLILLLVIGAGIALIAAMGVTSQITLYLFRLGYRKWKGNPTLRIVTDESQLQLGGFLTFEATFDSWLNYGFIKTIIRTRYEERAEYRILYNEEKQLGRLTRIYSRDKDLPTRWKWHIPSNFSSGEYRIRVLICDIDHILWFKITHTIFSEQFQISITEPIGDKITIERIMKPDINTIKCLDTKSEPKIGWVRVKIYNECENEFNDCFGYVKTDMGEYPLYDYKEYLKNSKDQHKDAFTSFTIKPNSGKLLYAEISTNESKANVTIDIGKKEITQDLPIDIQ